MKAARALVTVLLPLLAACQSMVSFPSAPLNEADRTPRQTSGVYTKPDGAGPFPAVVILHSCGGVQMHINSGWPAYLNGAGYAVLAVDTFGLGARCPHPLALDAGVFVKDAYGALDYLARVPEVDAGRVAVIGFSIGAVHISNALVHWHVRKPGERDFRAAIAFYGQCRPWMGYDTIPVLQIIAEHDDYSAGCRDLAKPGRPVEVRVIKDAYHAFDSEQYSGRYDPAGNRMVYSEAATLEARRHAREFLDRHLKPR